MAAKEDTREWARHAIRWEQMVARLKEWSAFASWYSDINDTLTTLEAQAEANLLKVEKMQRQVLEAL